MKWVKASERLPEITGWYFVKKNKLKNSTQHSIKDIFHFDWLKEKMEVPAYWCEIDVWLDESKMPSNEPNVQASVATEDDSKADDDKIKKGNETL